MLTIFRRLSARTAVEDDAARLIREHGASAHARAGEMSWREDAGLLASPRPGHWHEVQLRIARQMSVLPSPSPLMPRPPHNEGPQASLPMDKSPRIMNPMRGVEPSRRPGRAAGHAG